MLRYFCLREKGKRKMSTDKENIAFYVSILTLLLIVVCSMFVSFNIYDILYVIFLAGVIIRYITLCRKD